MEMALNNHTYYEERYRRIKALWLAVFVRAARDYALWKEEKRDIEKRKLADEAKRFIFDVTSGFSDMCTTFDLPLERLQEWADTLTRAEVRKIEMLERCERVKRLPPEVQQHLLDDEE